MGRRLRFEYLENRELLAVVASGNDLRALIQQKTDQSEVEPVYVTTLEDKIDANDGLISLREAIDYAGSTVGSYEFGQQILFSVSGTISLNASLGALVISKDLSIEAGNVGDITVNAREKSRVFLINGGTEENEISVSISRLTITGGKVSGLQSGAGIYLDSYSWLSLNDVVISQNATASGDGAGLYNNGSNVQIINSTFAENQTSDNGYGGGIYNASGEILLMTSTLTQNQAGNGGAVYSVGGVLEIADSTFSDNQATAGNGGAINSYGSYFFLENASFLRNTASMGNGGALYNSGNDQSYIKECGFFQNTAQNGGALCHFGNTLTTTASVFSDNSAVSDGGAVYILQSSYFQGEQNTLLRNQAGENGGALCNAGSLFLVDVTVQENSATLQGGGLCSFGAFEISNGSFFANSGKDGGAICLNSEDSTSFLSETVIQGNVSSSRGGGISVYGNLYAVGISLSENNAASYGGGIFAKGTVVLADSTILSNKAGQYGGGICNQENFYLSESTVAENQTKSQGAGIYNSISGLLGVYDSIIYKNSPKDPRYNFQGGGIYNDGEVTARNCLFEENSGMYGAGMYNSYSGTSTVDNSVFWGNEATEEGGAVYTVGALTVTDSSIQKNVAPTDVTSAGIYVHPNVRIQPVISGSTITDNQTSADVYQATRFLTLRNEDGYYLDGLFSSGMLANNDTTAAILKKTYTITNIYEKAVTLSGLSVSGVNYTNGFAYTIHDSDGKTVSATTVLEPGDSLYLDLTLKASITGTKFIQFRWNATTEDVTDEYFTFATAFNVTDSLTQGTTGGVVVSFDGTTASCSISLKSRPTSRVLVYLQPDNGLELSQSLFIFDSSNFSIAQSTTVSATKVDIGLDPDYQKLISWHVLTDDPTYLGTSIRNTLVTLENYLTVEKGGMVNLTSYSAFPASWDLNGDGYYEVRTDGKTPVWISESGFSSSVISYKESVNGTESDVLYMDVVKLETAPVITSALTVSDAVSQLAFLHLDIMTVSGVPVQSCRINWGDGSAPQYIEGAVSALDLNHYYLTGGDYAVSVEVVDASGYGANLFYQIGELTVSKAAVSASNTVSGSGLTVADDGLSVCFEENNPGNSDRQMAINHIFWVPPENESLIISLKQEKEKEPDVLITEDREVNQHVFREWIDETEPVFMSASLLEIQTVKSKSNDYTDKIFEQNLDIL